MNFFEKWKKKSFFSKFSDILFILLIVGMLIPQSRTAILQGVNRLKSFVIPPTTVKEELKLEEKDYSWRLYDKNGNTISFEQTKGKVVFLNFWATWCGPCLGEMPEIQKLYDEYKDNDQIVFMLVSNEPPDKIRTFVTGKNYTFPVYSSQVSPPPILQSSVIPTTFIIDKNGKIILKKKGVANWSGKKTKKIINSLLE